MKKLTASLVIMLFLGCVSVRAQDTKVKQSPGDFALLFDLSGLASLALNGLYSGPVGDSSFISGGFGAKYFVGQGTALRFGVSFSNLGGSTKIPPDSLNREDKTSVTSILLAPSITFNVASSGPVAGYVGGGLQFVTISDSPTRADTNLTVIKTSTTSFGVGALIGAEWFPWSHVSLSAEYALSFSTTSGTTTSTTGSTTVERDNPTATFIGLSSRGTLTAAIYF